MPPVVLGAIVKVAMGAKAVKKVSTSMYVQAGKRLLRLPLLHPLHPLHPLLLLLLLLLLLRMVPPHLVMPMPNEQGNSLQMRMCGKMAMLHWGSIAICRLLIERPNCLSRASKFVLILVIATMYTIPRAVLLAR